VGVIQNNGAQPLTLGSPQVLLRQPRGDRATIFDDCVGQYRVKPKAERMGWEAVAPAPVAFLKSGDAAKLDIVLDRCRRQTAHPEEATLVVKLPCTPRLSDGGESYDVQIQVTIASPYRS
jgi:hypothetical protein